MVRFLYRSPHTNPAPNWSTWERRKRGADDGSRWEEEYGGTGSIFSEEAALTDPPPNPETNSSCSPHRILSQRSCIRPSRQRTECHQETDGSVEEGQTSMKCKKGAEHNPQPPKNKREATT